ncbi:MULTISPECIES: tRNA lysidine(34) synthetase TilS [unclassified Oceanispirochaeta]|uniref:tRNA lysidine(34) synthetase TilS n=1 Tax=unclassified Oceanispirochaeta TaxID=2635722 RepID=UPI000E0987C2|nr:MULTISPECIES: tRNA lysidine(34) synthetase TilS [unclassified Oceanispirochaeta]MBF9018103.1 tRNA lysidine(34) synthetase TilS [Oceanispirochaeta sp. M2]NPD74567.1 tRNA lysidine(34) synthetase TilS [Oceanispirochaeta sp. M1]RDG29597.1 tRNA lysidine(34) synthetase TilS [Oceanispirochaeta sp. M1]
MKSIPERIEGEFLSSLTSLTEGITEPFRIIAAFSGGPDSTALLLLLSQFQKQFSYDLAAAYVNHGIRSPEECSDEEEQVESICRQLGIPLYKKRCSPGFLEHYSKLKSCGLEAAARTYRYHHFEKIAAQSGGAVLFALGHNQNDQAETILMRLFSGSSLEGLKGIPVKRDRYIRPLLNTDRVDIEKYLVNRDIIPVIDKSNLKTDFLRNKVRLDLLHTISESFPAVQDSLLRFQHDLKDVLEHYNGLLKKSCPWTVISMGESLGCSSKVFFQLPFVSRKSMILEQMNHLQKGLYSSDRRIPAAFFKPLQDNLKNGIILKGHGIIFQKKGEQLILSLLPDNGKEESHYSVFYLDKEHPYETESYIIELSTASELQEGDHILSIIDINPDTESISTPVIRRALGKSELRNFPVKIKDADLLLFCGNRSVCALNSQKMILPKNGKLKKISNIDSKSNVLCVIIRGRGHYAPG